MENVSDETLSSEVIVSREIHLTGESLKDIQVTTVHEDKTHEEISVEDMVASEDAISGSTWEVVEEQGQLDQSLVFVERQEAVEEGKEVDQTSIQVVATEAALTLSSEPASPVPEQKQEQQAQESSESEPKEEEEAKIEHTDFDVIATAATTEPLHTILSFTQLKDRQVEEGEEAEDALELDEQKAAEVDAMVNDDQDQVRKEIRVDTSFFLPQPHSEDFPGQREAAERIDKALAIAEAASPYSSVKSLIAPSPGSSSASEASSPSIASATTVATEETQYPANGQASSVREKRKIYITVVLYVETNRNGRLIPRFAPSPPPSLAAAPRYTLNTDAAVFTPSWLPKPTAPVSTDSRSSIFSAPGIVKLGTVVRGGREYLLHQENGPLTTLSDSVYHSRFE